MSWLRLLHPRPPDPPKPGPDGRAPPAADGKAPPAGPPPITGRLALGLLGAVLGSLMSNLNTRLDTFALVDLRGGVGLGLDEGAWVTEAFNIASIAIVPITPWLSGVISPRRAIAAAVALLTLAAVAVPGATSYPALVAFRFLQGVGGGALIPLLLGTVLRFLPMYQRNWGFAVYALLTTLTPLVSESIAGALDEYLGWQAIFWQNLLPGAVTIVLVLVGLPDEEVKLEAFAKADTFGMFTAVVFAGTLTAGLDQGQRLDWFSSGLITGLFVAAGTALAVFIWHSLTTKEPLIELRLLGRVNLSCGLLTIVAFSFASLGTSYILPQFGTEIAGFRELQVGDILIVVAISQLVLCPLAAALLRVVDARVLLVGGLTLATVGSRLATYVTADWVRGDFLLPLFVQACGLPFIMVPLLLVSTTTLQPQDAVAGGTLFNVLRTLAGSIGTAVIGAVITVRERVHSNLIVSHITAGAQATVQREAQGGPAAVAAAATRQAYVMAYADAYGVLGMVTLAGLLVVLFMQETRVSYPPKAGVSKDDAPGGGPLKDGAPAQAVGAPS